MPRLLSATLAGVAIVAAGAASAQPAPPPDEFTFRFQPPDGVRMNIDYVLKRTRTVQGSAPATDEAESRTSGVFKRSGEGYEYTPKTLSATLRRNGTRIGDPVTALLAKLEPRYTLTADGVATAVTGLGEVDKLLKASVPANVAAALATVINEETLATQQLVEWNARYGDFAGGTFTIGQVLDGEVPQPLPNGETLTYTVRTTFPRWEDCPAGRCVRVEQVYESDAQALATMATGVANRVIAAAAASAPPTSLTSSPGSRVSGSLSRLVDPKTMLIYSERLQRTISMRIASPGKAPEEVRLDEIRTYAHTYE
jgi:hypothetical protein